MSKQSGPLISKLSRGKIYRSFQELSTSLTNQQLKEKLWAYIIVNNPDLMCELQSKFSVDEYLDGQVSAILPTALKLTKDGHISDAVQELCMNELTANLKPSRYHYILSVLSEEFEAHHSKLKESGLLSYEATNLVMYCLPTFDAFAFGPHNEDDKQIYLAITGMIAEYFENR
jgi:hypothetical protein